MASRRLVVMEGGGYRTLPLSHRSGISRPIRTCWRICGATSCRPVAHGPTVNAAPVRPTFPSAPRYWVGVDCYTEAAVFETIRIRSPRRDALIDVTARVREVVGRAGVDEGVCH